VPLLCSNRRGGDPEEHTKCPRCSAKYLQIRGGVGEGPCLWSIPWGLISWGVSSLPTLREMPAGPLHRDICIYPICLFHSHCRLSTTAHINDHSFFYQNSSGMEPQGMLKSLSTLNLLLRYMAGAEFHVEACCFQGACKSPVLFSRSICQVYHCQLLLESQNKY